MDWHLKDDDDIVLELGTSKENGLSSDEAQRILKERGPNRFYEPYKVTFAAILKEEIVEPMILLLLFVGIMYSIWGGIEDSITIFVIIVVLVLVEVNNEYRAKRSIASLKDLSSPESSVVRDGKVTTVRTEDLVPGDILNVKMGDRVPADARILRSSGIEADESALTGESFPVRKTIGKIIGAAELAERNNMLFSGTVVTKGSGKAVIVSTGMESEIGRIGKAVKATRDPKTPLQLEMKALAKTLVWVALFFSILVPVLGLLRGGNLEQMILTGLSMAFATIPEELPIIITMVLGLGALSLSKRHALVKKLKAAETLGSVTIIATDKTGTLTENKMRLESLYTGGRKITGDFRGERAALDQVLLCFGVEGGMDPAASRGPMAEAVLTAEGVSSPDLSGWRLKDEISFDNVRKMASYDYETSGGEHLFSSGAPEVVLAKCSSIGSGEEMTDLRMKDLLEQADQMADAGQRVLAFARRPIRNPQDKQEEDMELIGMVGFYDPPRPFAKRSVESCRQAGIRVLMITGDHPRTAKAVAKAVGIQDGEILTGAEIDKLDDEALANRIAQVSVFARTTPEHKARLVRLLKGRGEIVAVTGDGINDAPALKEAHIGIAMGTKSTDVAKESADMVLTDDNFSTIQMAVGEGRKMFDNLSKGVRYYLACKMALVAAFLLPIALDVPLPFSPIQIIMLELFMDLGASAAFVAERAESDIMSRPPRDPKRKFMDNEMKYAIIAGAASLFTAVSFAYLYVWYGGADLATAQTVAFTTWLFGHIFLAFNMRSLKEPLISMKLTSNKLMLLWGLAALLFLLIAVPLPFLHATLRLTSLTAGQWALALAAAFVATFWMEAMKIALKGRRKVSVKTDGS
ncbi:MAG: Copper-exporting P-type ATPase B [Methanomassiliicoccales archaeon PtaU1.Bin124]|nr:MAG: Copper-exporting P-type ATPase B [Methanomassiliicoccales archaeon PtaU1.Bin124]